MYHAKKWRLLLRNYESGEIIEVAFPFEEKSDKKVRPALVISDDEFNGLSVDSVVQANQCRELEKSKIARIIPRGIINPLQFAIIKTRIKEFFTLA